MQYNRAKHTQCAGQSPGDGSVCVSVSYVVPEHCECDSFRIPSQPWDRIIHAMPQIRVLKTMEFPLGVLQALTPAADVDVDVGLPRLSTLIVDGQIRFRDKMADWSDPSAGWGEYFKDKCLEKQSVVIRRFLQERGKKGFVLEKLILIDCDCPAKELDDVSSLVEEILFVEGSDETDLSYNNR